MPVTAQGLGELGASDIFPGLQVQVSGFEASDLARAAEKILRS